MTFQATNNEQEHLLTVMHHPDREVRNALPGVHVTPLFLEHDKGICAPHLATISICCGAVP